jgi:hypothetical protein
VEAAEQTEPDTSNAELLQEQPQVKTAPKALRPEVVSVPLAEEMEPDTSNAELLQEQLQVKTAPKA